MRIEQLFPVAVDLAIGLPGGEPTGITLKVTSQDTKAFRTVAKRLASSMLGEQKKPDVEELEKQNAELVAATIVGWTGIEGEYETYSPEKAVALMTMPELTFMREQVEAFVKSRTNFFRPGTGAA